MHRVPRHIAVSGCLAQNAVHFQLDEQRPGFVADMQAQCVATTQKLRAALFGKPCFLIEKGTINQKEMHRCRFSVDELTEELRRQSVTDLSTVEYAILETDGTLNVILTPAERPVTAGQLRCAEPETGYPYILISDGTVLRENLRKCGKTEEWLRGECRRQGVKSPEQVFLLTCDTTGNVYFAKREKRP